MQLEIGQVLTQILAFLIMLWILKRFAWKPLLGIMEERKEKITQEFDLIEQRKQEAEQLNEKYQNKLKALESEAGAKIQDAVDKGRRLAEEIQTEANQQAKEMLRKAKTEIDGEIKKAKGQLKQDVIKISIAATQKILEENLDDQKQAQLIAKFVEEVKFE